MNKEEYLEKLESIKKEIKEKNESINVLRDEYVEANKPCNIGDNATIKLGSGRMVSGEVRSFGILGDTNVYVTSYRDGSNMKYITTPHLELKVNK